MKRLSALAPLVALAVLAVLAAGALLLGGRILPDEAAPGVGAGGRAPNAPASAEPAPSAQQESGLPEDETVPAAAPPPARRPALKERIQPRPTQAQAARPPIAVAQPTQPSTGQAGSAAAPAPGSGGSSTGAAPMPGPGAGPQETDAAAPPPAAGIAPAPAQPPTAPASPPVTAAPVVTPPVPVALHPPQHPDAWRVVVEPPGLAAEARSEHVSARVRLRLLVREDGAVGRVEVAVPSGRPELDAAAAAAAAGWRFLPARRDGAPIASIVLIWVAFVGAP